MLELSCELELHAQLCLPFARTCGLFFKLKIFRDFEGRKKRNEAFVQRPLRGSLCVRRLFELKRSPFFKGKAVIYVSSSKKRVSEKVADQILKIRIRSRAMERALRKTQDQILKKASADVTKNRRDVFLTRPVTLVFFSRRISL